MPKISIVVPVYKVEKYIRRCVDSVLRQTMEDYELILVDDGSPDACGSICDQYAARDDRIIVIHQKNGGLSAARNSGIEWALANSDSQWITFIDSDDWVHPRYLEELFNAASKTKLSVAICDFLRTAGEELPAVFGDPTVTVLPTEQFYCQQKVRATVAWGKLYCKESFQELRYPEGKIHEDEFTTYKVLFSYEEVAVVEAPLYAYYQNPQSIMGSRWSPKHMAEPEAMLEQHAFFCRNGFHKAESYLARLYLISLYRNLEQAKTAGEEQEGCARRLKKALQKGLVKYGKLAGVSLRNENWLYYAAYPMGTIPVRLWNQWFGKAKSKGE